MTSVIRWTLDRINNASFRLKLDPISKNVLRRQNPLELVSEDISTFDAVNPVVGSLLRELNVNRKGLASDLLKGAPETPRKNLEIQKRLDSLKGADYSNSNNNSNNSNNNNNFSPPPSSPTLLPPPGLSSGLLIPPAPPFVPPPSGRFLEPFQPPPQSNNSFGNFHIPAQLSSVNFNNRNSGLSWNLFGSQTATLNREKDQENVVQDSVREELDDTIYELPDPEQLELSDGLLYVLGVEADDVLDQ